MSRLGMFSPDLPDDDFASSLLGPDPMLQLVQEGAAGARRQAAPRVQNVPALPGERRPAPRAAAPAPPAPPPEDDYAGSILGKPTPSPSFDPRNGRLSRQRSSTGDARGAVQRYFEGYTDPAYKDVRGVTPEDLMSVPNADASAMYRAQVTAPNDAAYADMLRQAMGQDLIRTEQDQHGQQVLVFRGQDGSEQKRYVNQPGLDWQDVQRGVLGAVPYLMAGGAVAKAQRGAGMLANVVGQTTAAGGTALANNAASRMQGSKQPVDIAQTGITAAAGGAGALLARPIGALQRAQQVRGLVDEAGNLTERGVALAKKSGIDPEALQGQAAREFAQTYAMTQDAAEAAVRGTTAEFGIPVSRGQLTKDPAQLTLEKAYRNNIYGTPTRDVMTTFDRQQVDAIAQAALGGGQRASIAPMLNPNRGLVDQGADTLGEAIRGGVAGAKQEGRAASKQAFKDAGDATPTPEALLDLPRAIQGRLGSFRISDKLHPTADDMGKQIAAFMEGKAPGNSVPSVFGTGQVPRVDEFRKELFKAYQGAQPGADKAAAGLIYKGYQDWLEQASNRAMLQGDAAFAAKNRIARDVHRSVMEAFEPRADGKKLPAANVIGKVLKPGTSAEEVVQTLFGAPGLKSAPKEGSVQALQNIKRALNTWGDGKGGARSQTWDDIRLAYWVRLVQDKQGNVLTPQVMLNNIQNALQSQRSIMGTLYGKDELGAMIRFSQGLRSAAWKDPNPSGTATALGVLTKDFATTLIKALGWQGNGLAGLLGSTALMPVRNLIGAQGARSATAQRSARVIDPPVGPYAAAGTQALLRTDLGGQ